MGGFLKALYPLLVACLIWSCKNSTDPDHQAKVTEITAAEYAEIDTTAMWVGLEFCAQVRNFTLDSAETVRSYRFTELIYVTSETCRPEGSDPRQTSILIGLNKKDPLEYFCFNKESELPQLDCEDKKYYRISM